jgi:phospholipid transport system substrate-binding protein
MFFILTTHISAADNVSDNKQVEVYINNLANRIIEILTSSESEASKEATLKLLIVDNIDVEVMTKYCLGREYLNLNTQQKADFTKVYKDYLVKIYSNNIKRYITSYQGQTMSIQNITPFQNNERVAVVGLFKDKDSANNKKITYIINNSTKDSKIIDIISNGVSILNTQRDSFGSILKTPDGFNKLLENLSKPR